MRGPSLGPSQSATPLTAAAMMPGAVNFEVWLLGFGLLQ